jgi:hypothetical protein
MSAEAQKDDSPGLGEAETQAVNLVRLRRSPFSPP